MKFEGPRERPEEEAREGSREYEVSGEVVKVSWKIFPPKEEGIPGRAVVFIPGWSISEQAKSIEILCEEFADYSGSPAYAVDSRTDTVLPNSTEVQAEAVRRFIEE